MTASPRAPIGRIWLAILGIVISIAALWIALQNVDLGAVAQRLSQADIMYLLAAVGVGAIQVLLRTKRWQILLPVRADGTRVPIRRLVPVLLIGYLGNVALPARLGEVVRTYLVARREGLDAVTVLGTVVLERILDLVALAGFAFVVAVAVGAPAWILGGAGVAAVLGLVALFVATAGLPLVVRLVNQRVEPDTVPTGWRRLPGLRFVLWIAGRFSAGVGSSHRPLTVVAAAVLSFLAWPLDALLVWLAASSIGIEIGPATAALISAAAVLSTAVPSAPGYVGTYELAAAFAAQAMGVASDPAFAIAVLAHALTILPAAIAGAISLVVLRESLGPAVRSMEPETPLPGG